MRHIRVVHDWLTDTIIELGMYFKNTEQISTIYQNTLCTKVQCKIITRLPCIIVVTNLITLSLKSKCSLPIFLAQPQTLAIVVPYNNKI